MPPGISIGDDNTTGKNIGDEASSKDGSEASECAAL